MAATVGSNLQEGWTWCKKCEGLFFGGNGTTGRCPAGGSHSTLQSGAYFLQHGSGDGQAGWRWCSKCQGLFFPGGATRCPAGGAHNGAGSGVYVLPYFLFGDAQPNWAHCRKCQGLFFAGNTTKGRCPASGTHDTNSAFSFTLHKQ